MEIANKKTVLYCRVSSKEQEETGYSLDAQEKLLADYSQKEGYKLLKKFRVTESASKWQIRKTLNEMLVYADKNEVEIILCEKIDRLTRSLKDAAIVDGWVHEKDGREVHFVKEHFILNTNTKAHDNLVWDMKVAVARFYTNNLSEEVKKGQQEKSRQGWLPTKPPMGYKTIGEKGRKIHIIDENVAPYVKQMFEWYATGNYSTTTVTERLNQKGFRTRLGKKMCRSKTHALLTDPFYHGDFRWKGKIYEGKHEPLVSKDLWDKVQEELGLKNTGPKLPQGHLFMGKVHCVHCEGLMTWYEQKGHVYGHCSYHGRSKHCQGKTCLREELVEKQVIAMLESLAPANQEVLAWIEEVIRAEYSDQVNRREKEISAITRRLQEVREKKDKTMEAKVLEKAPLEYCERKIAEYYAEEKGLESDLEKITDKNHEYQNLTLIIHELAFRAAEIYKKASQDQKRILFKEIFNDLLQDGKAINPKFTEAASYLNSWMPVVNGYYEQHGEMPEVKQILIISPFVDFLGITSKEPVTMTLRTKEFPYVESGNSQKVSEYISLLPG